MIVGPLQRQFIELTDFIELGRSHRSLKRSKAHGFEFTISCSIQLALPQWFTIAATLDNAQPAVATASAWS